jgi:hypothetical protein
MRPDQNIKDAFDRLPLFFQGFLVVWLILALVFGAVDELGKSLPTWFAIFLGLPWLLLIPIAIWLNILGFRSIVAAFRKPAPAEEADPAAQYLAGEISHPEMMEHYDERELRSAGDLQGCSIIFGVVSFSVLSIVSFFPRNPDNSMRVEYVTPALVILGLVSAYLLKRGIAKRAVKLACYTFLVIAAVGVPAGLISIFLR